MEYKMNIIREFFSTGIVRASIPNIFSILIIEPIKNQIIIQSTTVTSSREITGNEYILIQKDNPLLVKLKNNNESFF